MKIPHHSKFNRQWICLDNQLYGDTVNLCQVRVAPSLEEGTQLKGQTILNLYLISIKNVGKLQRSMKSYFIPLLQNPDSRFRLWAASKARSFFRRNGYKQVSNEPSECRHSVMIFQHLYPMEKLDSSQNNPSTATGQNKKRYRNRRKPKNKTSQPSPMYGPG